MSELISAAALDSHVRRFFASRACSRRDWQSGASAKMWPGLYALHVHPEPADSGHVFTSIGASSVRSGYHREFILLTAGGGDHHVETLFIDIYDLRRSPVV